MSNELKCPICGQPTRVYMGNARKDRLCGKHADELKQGLIVLKDGKYVSASEVDVQVKEEIKENSESDSSDAVVVKCIGCGKETKNGNLFCYSCYKKFRDKQLLVKITKCKEIEILDESYEGVYTCKDGHIVKSKSEREIDNYLFDHGIPHAYEKAIAIDSNPKNDLHPDFYLPNYKGQGDVYIEHWGFNSNNIEYTKSRKYKVNIYKKLNLTVICTNEHDQNDINVALDRKLNFFKTNEVNYDEE